MNVEKLPATLENIEATPFDIWWKKMNGIPDVQAGANEPADKEASKLSGRIELTYNTPKERSRNRSSSLGGGWSTCVDPLCTRKHMQPRLIDNWEQVLAPFKLSDPSVPWQVKDVKSVMRRTSSDLKDILENVATDWSQLVLATMVELREHLRTTCLSGLPWQRFVPQLKDLALDLVDALVSTLYYEEVGSSANADSSFFDKLLALSRTPIFAPARVIVEYADGTAEAMGIAAVTQLSTFKTTVLTRSVRSMSGESMDLSGFDGPLSSSGTAARAFNRQSSSGSAATLCTPNSEDKRSARHLFNAGNSSAMICRYLILLLFKYANYLKTKANAYDTRTARRVSRTNSAISSGASSQCAAPPVRSARTQSMLSQPSSSGRSNGSGGSFRPSASAIPNGIGRRSIVKSASERSRTASTPDLRVNVPSPLSSKRTSEVQQALGSPTSDMSKPSLSRSSNSGRSTQHIPGHIPYCRPRIVPSKACDGGSSCMNPFCVVQHEGRRPIDGCKSIAAPVALRGRAEEWPSADIQAMMRGSYQDLKTLYSMHSSKWTETVTRSVWRGAVLLAECISANEMWREGWGDLRAAVLILITKIVKEVFNKQHGAAMVDDLDLPSWLAHMADCELAEPLTVLAHVCDPFNTFTPRSAKNWNPEAAVPDYFQSEGNHAMLLCRYLVHVSYTYSVWLAEQQKG